MNETSKKMVACPNCSTEFDPVGWVPRSDRFISLDWLDVVALLGLIEDVEHDGLEPAEIAARGKLERIKSQMEQKRAYQDALEKQGKREKRYAQRARYNDNRSGERNRDRNGNQPTTTPNR